MDKKRFLALVSMATMFLFLTGCAGVSRINAFIGGGEFKQHANVIDFGLFFVIFFSMTYLGLTKIWGKGYGEGGKAKGAIVGLSIALGLAFAFAIVSQTSFSVTTMYPMAKAFFFLICTFILSGLIIKSEVFGKGKIASIIAIVISLIAMYLVFSIGSHMICQMTDNMDDPACKSDFFNFGFTLLGRLFGVESWATSGGGGWTGYDTSGGWFKGSNYFDRGTGTPIAYPEDEPGGDKDDGEKPESDKEKEKEEAKPIEQPGGEPQGVCRFDITFVKDSDTQTTSDLSSLSEFVKQAYIAGHKTFYVWGYASVDGSEEYNKGLSRRRANTITDLFRNAASATGADIWVIPSARGETRKFGETTIDYAPNRRVVIAVKSISNAAPAPSPGTIYGCDPKSDDDRQDDPIISWWGWLLLALALLLLILLGRKVRRRRKHDRPKKFIAAKAKFMKEISATADRKEHEWENNVKTNIKLLPYHKDITYMENRSRAFIDHLERELSEKWVPLLTLYQRYQKDLDKIKSYAHNMGLHESDAHNAHKLLTRMVADHGKEIGALNFQQFDEKAAQTAKSMLHENLALNYFKNFISIQREMQREVADFKKKEERLIKYLHKGKFEDSMTGALIKVTESAEDLCGKLNEQIDEVIRHAKETSEDFVDMETLEKKYGEEKELLASLLKTVASEKKLLEEGWFPVIDDVDQTAGSMEGHIHNR